MCRRRIPEAIAAGAAPMTNANRTAPSTRRKRRRWLWLSILPAGLFGACWWLTEPLEEPETSLTLASPAGPASAPAPATPGDSPPPKAPPAWPEGRLEGEPAKRLLLDLLVEAAGRF